MDPDVKENINVHGEKVVPIYLSGREMALLFFATQIAADDWFTDGAYTRSRTLYLLGDRLETMLKAHFPGAVDSLS